MDIGSFFGFCRGIAQLAERRSPKPKVGGSRPSAPANRILVKWNGHE